MPPHRKKVPPSNIWLAEAQFSLSMCGLSHNFLQQSNSMHVTLTDCSEKGEWRVTTEPLGNCHLSPCGFPQLKHNIQCKQKTHHFLEQVPDRQLKASASHFCLITRADLSLVISTQTGLQTWVKSLVHVSELRHLVENGLDLLAGQNWLRGPSWSPQSLHGLDSKIKKK